MRHDKPISHYFTKSVRQIAVRLLFILPLATYIPVGAQPNGYFVSFTDKINTGHTVSAPHTYLSERAIGRRLRQQIAIDSTDLPVTKMYVDSLSKLGIKVLHTSKWLNGAVVSSSDNALMDTLGKLSFVKSVELTKGVATGAASPKFAALAKESLKSVSGNSNYGEAYLQIKTVNGDALHDQGYTGKDMHIAVIDAGFYNADQMPLLAHLFDNGQILGTRDFVAPGGNVLDADAHGMHVLSIMAGNSPNAFVGTAPDASYWLLRTEDVATEFPIEADYWVCAAEFADSAGVDVINSSLGYGYYDNPLMDLTYSQLNGKSRISLAANMAVAKGMVVVNSAGNEGNKTWQYVLTPADATQVIAVGAIAADSTRAAFSSVGPTADFRIKPDLMAMGYLTAVQATDGTIRNGSGTSYSAPVVSGLVACLWQSAPWLNSSQLVDIIKADCHQRTAPSNLTGYGIPNFKKTWLKHSDTTDTRWSVMPNPFISVIQVTSISALKGLPCTAKLFDHRGAIVAKKTSSDATFAIDNLNSLSKGIYLLMLQRGNSIKNIKLIKK